MKICIKCKNEYPATPEYFYRDKRCKDGLIGTCKKCYYKRSKKYRQTEKGKVIYRRGCKKYMQTKKGKQAERKYRLKQLGVTLEQYDEMFEAQNGVCAVCNGINENGTRLGVDHNHKTGKVRGLLCTGCNLAVGNLKENKERILALALYLEKRKD